MIRRIAWGVSIVALSSLAAFAQSVISARSGLIHYLEGQVYLGDQVLESKFGQFPEVKENQVLRATEGRAEVLLTPGVFLRLGENSSFKMITNRLIDTRIEFLSGTAIVEADDILKDNAVTVVYGDTTARLLKKGLYRFTSSPAELRVFDGEAEVTRGEQTVSLKDGKLVDFDAALVAQKFDKDSGDALNRWSRRRSEALSMANISAAKSIYDTGMGFTSNQWIWNPFFGMFTFVPYSGSFYSPYGFRFWSPMNVYRAYYAPRPVYNFGGGNPNGNYGGYNTMAHTSGGYSGAVASSASMPASSATHSAAPAPSAGASSGVSHTGGSGATGGHR